MWTSRPLPETCLSNKKENRVVKNRIEKGGTVMRLFGTDFRIDCR